MTKKLSKIRRIQKCTIHIGTEKTGSTAIQSVLQSKRKALRKQGILYPGEMDGPRASQFEFVAAVQSEPWRQDIGRAFGITNEKDQERFRKRLANKLTSELDKSSSIRRLIISSEHFHSRLNTVPQIQNLKNYLRNWSDEFEVIVYFRRQDEVAISFQSTRLKSAVQLSDLSLFGDGRGPLAYYNYYDLYNKWANVFGAGAIKPRLFAPEHWAGGNLVQDFVQTSDLDFKVTDHPNVNKSLSAEGFHFLRAINRLYPITPGDSSDDTRTKLVKEVSESFTGKFYPISREEAKRFLDQFAESNEALRRTAFPDLPSPLFDPDLSAYPESAGPIEPAYDDAVRVAFALWKKKQLIPEDRFKERVKSLINRLRSTIMRS